MRQRQPPFCRYGPWPSDVQSSGEPAPGIPPLYMHDVKDHIVQLSATTHPVRNVRHLGPTGTQTKRENNVINVQDAFCAVRPLYSHVPLQFPCLLRLLNL